MRRTKGMGSRAGALFLSVTMMTALFPGEMLVQADVGVGDTAYADTDAADQTKTTRTGETENNWKIVWSDEFKGTELDSTKWTSMVGTGAEYSDNGWGNNELEYYTDGENIDFVDTTDENGNPVRCLEITAKKTTAENKGNYANKDYTSARLWTMSDSPRGGEKTTKFAKTYGRIEAKIRIDGGGTGLWPAFWMMPADDVYGTWAASGELDIMEARGSNKGAVDGTLHFGSQWPDNTALGSHYNENTPGYDPNFTIDDWHTYAVEWVPGEIRWYMDNVLFYTENKWYSTSKANAADYTYPAPFDRDFYILLNLAVGGNYDQGALDTSWDNAKMLVDYVRVYDLADESFNPVGYDESNVQKPVDAIADTPISGSVGDNYVSSSLSGFAKTTGYPGEADKSKWYVSELAGGAATVSMDSDALKVNVTDGGSENYSLQLIHQVPLTKGYRYVMTFQAKADEAKTLNAKFGNIGGYPAYSSTMNVDLKTGWKEYSYVFDMKNDSDAAGRIEINMGQTTGACYFKDFSIVTTGKTPLMGEDDEKEPLADGNHIYNGTFDQGAGRTYFWHTLASTGMSASKAAMELKVEGTEAASGVYQSGINLLANDTYELTFDAKAQAAGDITVQLLSKDSGTEYHSENVAVGTDYASEKYKVTFTMNAGVTDTDAVVAFVTGNNTVYLDNIKMIRTTNNNLDWSQVDIWPLYNYDFFNGKEGWNIWSENGSSVNSYVSNQKKLIMDINILEGANFWNVGAQTPSMFLKAGVPYVISINLSGQTAKTITVGLPGGEEKNYDFAANGQPLVLNYTPLVDIPSGKVTLFFGNGAGGYHCEIESIDVAIDTTKLTLPANSARPASVASAQAVKAGASFVINHNNDTWAEKISEVYVNEEPIDLSKVDASASGKLTIDGSVIPNKGTYTLEFAADGYCNTKPIVQKVLSADGNVIVNGTFDADASGWSNWFNGTGSLSVQNGEAVMSITGSQNNNWDSQLKQDGIELQAANYYVLSFDAYADITRPLELEFKDLGTPSKTIVDLTGTQKTYHIAFNNVSATKEASVLFMAGNVKGCLADFGAVGAHNVYIDNVVLKEATEAEVEAITTPKVSLKKQAVIGQDVILTYTENNAWEANTVNAYVGSNKVSVGNYTVDTSKNTITINADQFTDTGSTEIILKVNGYDDISVKIRVLESESNLFAGDWFTWQDGNETGTMTLDDNSIDVEFKATVNSEWNSPMFWSMQASKQNIFTEAGKQYKLTFDAEVAYEDKSVTADRKLIVEMGTKSGGNSQKTYTLSEGKKRYEHTFTPGTYMDYYIQFMPGGADDTVAPHNLKITNITLKEVSIADAQIPELTKDLTNVTCEQKAASALQVTAAAADGGKLSYQWYKNTVNCYSGAAAIAGAEASSYTPDTAAAGATYYYCVVTNTKQDAEGLKTAFINSTIAKLTVTALPDSAQTPTITKQPVNAVYAYNGAASNLSVTASVSDGGTLSYQWYKNSKNSTSGASAIAGATKADYQPAVNTVGTTYYYCVVTNTNHKTLTTKQAAKNSNIISVKVDKAANKINVKTGVKKAFGDKAFTLGAKAQGTLSYKSANTKVVEVNKSGKVTIKGCGKTTITISAGNSNYQTATTKVTITVTPKKETITSFKSSEKKAATVKWKKDTKATGYMIQYSTNKNFKGAKTVTIKKNSTVSQKLTKLTGGKKYYVRVCAYKTSGKEKLYGEWSAVKNTVVKK